MSNVELSPVQINEINLQSVHFELGTGIPSNESEALNYELNFEVGVGFREDNRDKALVKVMVSVDWEAETPPFELSVSYLGFVSQDGSFEQEDFEKICRSRITMIILGQLRPFVSRLMSEAKEDFRLPLLDLRKLTEKSDQQDS